METLLKAKDVMQQLNISRVTLSKYVKLGILKVAKSPTGRYLYTKESIDNLLKNGVDKYGK